jgi:putative transposase
MPVRLEKAMPCRACAVKWPLRKPPIKAAKGAKMNLQSLAHTKWDCKYHVVIVPKYRHKVLYGKVRTKVGAILRELCTYKGIEIVEAHAMPDHIHMCISVPPKYSIAMVIGYLKGKSAIRINREILEVRKNFTGKSFWTRGYYVSTVGLDENIVREYIRNQERLDSGEEGQLHLKGTDIN